jgi:ferrous iron transport protein A
MVRQRTGGEIGLSTNQIALFRNRARSMSKTQSLGQAQRGFIGRIQALDTKSCGSVIAPGELESRLIEMGFVEDARVEILHEGMFGRDPIAVRVNNATVAIRRREAMAIIVD